MKTISLHGNWHLIPTESTKNSKFLKAFNSESPTTITFPGDIYSALYSQDIIQDPYFEMNANDIQWVGDSDWECSRTFSVSKSFLTGQQFITIEGIDTFFRIFINDNEIGHGSNSFRKWRFNVSDFLIQGLNTIRITFESASKYAFSVQNRSDYKIPRIDSPYFPNTNINFIRKSQIHGGTNGSPKLLTSGIYDSIKLEQTSKGFIEYVSTNIKKIQSQEFNNVWDVQVSIWYSSLFNGTIKADVSLDGYGIEPITNQIETKVKKGLNEIQCHLQVKDPALWWNAGQYSQQERYFSDTFFENQLYNLSVSIQKDIINKKIAFRTIEILPENGNPKNSLYYKINDKIVYEKAFIWYPCDCLFSNQKKEKYIQLIKTALASNCNSIHVWGGGQYEKDIFYDLCDKYGIIIRQDFMFANALYPSTPSFLESVKKEVRHQILKLQSHPCIALWSGSSSSVDEILSNFTSMTQQLRDKYIINFDRLTEGVIKTEVKKFDSQRSYIAYVAKSYTIDNQNDGYILPQKLIDSYPSSEAISLFLGNDQQNPTSPAMEFHQAKPSSACDILVKAQEEFQFPKDFRSLIYISQLQQALQAKTIIEYKRRQHQMYLGDSIWQLNESFPGVTSSSVEYYGKRKMIQYAIASSYEPISIVQFKKNDTLFAYTLNDTDEDIDSHITISFISFDGNIIEAESFNRTLKPTSAEQIFTREITEMPALQNECFVFAQLDYSDSSHTTISRTHTLFVAKPKKCELQESNLKIEVENQIDEHAKKDVHKSFLLKAQEYRDELSKQKNDFDESNIFKVIITAQKPAFFVWLDAEKIPGAFSTNMITVLPNNPYIVFFKATKKGITSSRLQKAIKITSLRDSYL